MAGPVFKILPVTTGLPRCGVAEKNIKRAAGTDEEQTAVGELQAEEQAAADYLHGVPENQRAYGIVSVGAALGDDDYVQMYLRAKGDELCGEGDGIIDQIAMGLAHKSEQAANVASVISLQERINYLAGTHLPSETMELRQMMDDALRRADEHILGADFMNEQGIERAPG